MPYGGAACIFILIIPIWPASLVLWSCTSRGLTDVFWRKLIGFVQTVRKQPVKKPPSITESVDWAMAMHMVAEGVMTPEVVRSTLSALLKYTRDRDIVLDKLPYLLREDG